MSESRALVPLAGPGEVAVFNPGTFELMQRVASAMSRATILPDHLKGRTPDETFGNCFLVVNQAYNWQMNPVAVAQGSYIVHGRLSFSGALVAAAIENKLGIQLKKKFEGEKGTPQRKITLWDPEDPEREVSGTVADWQTKDRDGNVTRQWQAQPDDQLIYRGTRQWCRRHEPAIILGVYTGDEMEDASYRDAQDITPRRAKAAEQLPQADGRDRRAIASPAPPAIPDAPPRAAAPPPPIPDLPPHDAVTGEIVRTDAEFLAALDADLAACGSVDDLLEAIEANKAETDARGLQQEIADRVGRHRVRIHDASHAAAAPKPPAQIAAEEAYVRIGQAIRAASTIDELAAAWKAAQSSLRTLPDDWQASLTADKDRRKAEFQPQTHGAAA
jgi:hypothetical protein